MKTTEIDDSLIVELGKAINDLQLALVKRGLPPIQSISVHPVVEMELARSARGNSPYLVYKPNITKRERETFLCGTKITAKTSDAQSINPE